MKLGEGGPCEEIIGAQLRGHQRGTQGSLKLAVPHQGHTKGVPRIIVAGVQLRGLTVKPGSFSQFAHGHVAAGFIHEVLGR